MSHGSALAPRLMPLRAANHDRASDLFLGVTSADDTRTMRSTLLLAAASRRVAHSLQEHVTCCSSNPCGYRPDGAPSLRHCHSSMHRFCRRYLLIDRLGGPVGLSRRSEDDILDVSLLEGAPQACRIGDIPRRARLRFLSLPKASLYFWGSLTIATAGSPSSRSRFTHSQPVGPPAPITAVAAMLERQFLVLLFEVQHLAERAESWTLLIAPQLPHMSGQLPGRLARPARRQCSPASGPAGSY